MIIEIKIANYRSINAEQTFSFVAENARRHDGNLIPRKGYKLLKAAALFGANASGKSNLVKAIGAMRDFIRDSATRMNDGDPIAAAEPFRLDPGTRRAPSRFELTFLVDAMLYTYGFAADASRVQGEWLKAQPEEGRAETFGFDRTYDGATDSYNYEWRGTLKSVADLLRDRTRSNALTLSTGARENVPELLTPYRFFYNQVHNYDMSGAEDMLLKMSAELCKGNTFLLQTAQSMVHDMDIGIDSISITNPRMATPPDDKIIRLDSSDAVLLELNFMKDYIASPDIISSRLGRDGEKVLFDFVKDESSGTRRFFTLAVLLTIALATGDFFTIDELDASMHPLLTRKLLELFQSTHANTNGAQLLFTTHDPSLLDQELFRRDQVWLVEKRNHASTFFSLADIEPRPRNTEAFLRNYLAGRYGGIPHLGRAFDTLKVGEVK